MRTESAEVIQTSGNGGNETKADIGGRGRSLSIVQSNYSRRVAVAECAAICDSYLRQKTLVVCFPSLYLFLRCLARNGYSRDMLPFFTRTPRLSFLLSSQFKRRSRSAFFSGLFLQLLSVDQLHPAISFFPLQCSGSFCRHLTSVFPYKNTSRRDETEQPRRTRCSASLNKFRLFLYNLYNNWGRYAAPRSEGNSLARQIRGLSFCFTFPFGHLCAISKNEVEKEEIRAKVARSWRAFYEKRSF